MMSLSPSQNLNLSLDTTTTSSIEMEGKKKEPLVGDDMAKMEEEGQTFEVLQMDGGGGGGIDRVSERSYVWKLDCYLLPFLSLMYFFNSVDRSNLGNAKTDGIDTDLHFKGNEYSLLILLFYIPFGLCDLPLNLLTKLWSGRVMLPTLMVTWGSLALLQCAAKNFAGLLVIRLFLGACEAGFFAGVVFYLTLFYTRPELGFRLALFFGSALLAAAFSGLISYGVFRITNTSIPGWKYLFIIEGSMTVLVGLVAFWWLPASPSSAWFLNDEEKIVAEKRMLRDGSRVVGTGFSLRAAFRGWRERPGRFLVWCAVAFTYPVAFSTTSNFLPQIVARLGYSTIKTNLWTVAPNAVGFITLLAICKSSDHFRERTYHIIFSLLLSLLGMIILASIDVLAHKNIAYFACFLMAAGSYIPSVLVHSWHNNNNLDENSRAATTGFLVGLGNLAGILSAATFRVEFAPGYRPTLVATAACNVVCIVLVAGLGGWMKVQNRRRDRLMGISGGASGRVYVDTERLGEGEDSPEWRFFT